MWIRALMASLLALQVGCGGAAAAKAIDSANQTPTGNSSSTTTPDSSSSPAANSAPIFATQSSLSIQENKQNVVQIQAADADGDSIEYSMTGGADRESFTLSLSGQLAFATPPDYESAGDSDSNNTYLVSITADDKNNNRVTLALQISVKNLLEGYVIDGPLKNSPVFLDLNNNKLLDEGEPQGTTDGSGYFELDASSLECTSGICSATVVATGGTDTSTNENVEMAIYSNVLVDQEFAVTPLGAILSESTDQTGVLANFGIRGTPEEILAINPWADANRNSGSGIDLLKVNQQIGILLETVTTIVAETPGSVEKTSVSSALAKAISEQIVTDGSNGPLTLSDASVLDSLIENTLTTLVAESEINSSDVPDATRTLAIAKAISSTNEKIAAATTDPTGSLASGEISKAQDDLQDSIKELLSSAITVDEFVASSNEAIDSDGDGLTNSTDDDDDNDGVADSEDLFPLDPTESTDADSDGIGDNNDSDDDNDSVTDTADAFPLDPTESLDTDNDGIGNNTDSDDDGDGVSDFQDALPLNKNESVDTDSDGLGNNEDLDDDGDTTPDVSDAFPLDPVENADTDGDGVGDNRESDSDNILDAEDDLVTEVVASSGIEYEPNETLSGAQKIGSGVGVSGSISSWTDKDWYAVDVTAAGTLTAKFDVDTYESSGWDIDIQDSSGNTLGAFNCSYSACRDDGVSLAVGVSSAGTYYVRVSQASQYNQLGGGYTLKVTVGI